MGNVEQLHHIFSCTVSTDQMLLEGLDIPKDQLILIDPLLQDSEAYRTYNKEPIIQEAIHSRIVTPAARGLPYKSFP